ncbi:MAG: hypothetical protein KDK36_15305, partial [Leptospiraceae bacterium]|nr:hypothetical protein [Leptospiraceae bacterium]
LMCDTFTVSGIFSDRDAVFAKNSDRYPGEPQFTQIVYPEDISIKDVPSPKEEYLNKSYKRLTDIFSKYSNPYGAILSRIPWMWGAEMGTNENGVTIGNEAVFSKVDKPEEDGLLGMDILRLALHNSETAKSALEFITGIISKYGQGGNGAFIGKLFYNNSFLIRDQKDAFVLETSGKNWGWKQINKTCSISNAYSPFSFDQSNIPFQTESFKKNHESKFYTFFSQGDKRRQTTSSLISDIKSNDLTEIFDILKYHDDNFHIAYGMRSICMHANFPVKSETRASWVTDYIAGKSIVWFTSSPNPCVSIFKPMIYDK